MTPRLSHRGSVPGNIALDYLLDWLGLEWRMRGMATLLLGVLFRHPALGTSGIANVWGALKPTGVTLTALFCWDIKLMQNGIMQQSVPSVEICLPGTVNWYGSLL